MKNTRIYKGVMFVLILTSTIFGSPHSFRINSAADGLGSFNLKSPETLVRGRSVRSYRSLRYDRVVGQTAWFTCGPAAVATLLHLYREGEGVTESSLLKRAMKLQPDYAKGFNLLTLTRILRLEGYESVGYRLTAPQLQNYFLSGALPVIMHVKKPMIHYVILIGFIDADFAVIFDPSWGRQVVPYDSYVRDKGFEGHVLIPIPDKESNHTARGNQMQIIEWARERLKKLRSITM